MEASNTHFEQIPIATVKRIARKFSDKNVSESDSVNTETQNQVSSHHEGWREVAQKVQHEGDPKRMIDLVEQLIAMFDEQELCKRRLRKQDTGDHLE